MTATSLRRLVSPYVGIVRSLDELLATPADARLPTFGCQPADDARLLGAPLDALGGVGGSAPDREAATAAAIGEAVERYSLSYVPGDRLVLAAARDLPGAVEPARFALFSTAQYASPGFPFAPFGADTLVPWVDGWDVDNGGRVWLPAELVFLADPVPTGMPRIGYATSSGAACGPTRAEALLRGLLELCERDAFMIVWACRLSLPRLDWHGSDELRRLDRRWFAPTGLEYAALDLSPFHRLPSVLGLVRAPDADRSVLGVGAGTAATVERAWWKALSEAFACRTAGRKLLARDPSRRFARDGSDVRSFDDHIAFHATPQRRSVAAFLDASGERVDVGEVAPLPAREEEQLEAVVQRIRASGATALAVDVTSPDVREVGLHVVKAVAPGLCMLDVLHRARFLGGRRLASAAAEVGLLPTPLAPDELNADPHPFP